jgi:hypothetical protein
VAHLEIQLLMARDNSSTALFRGQRLSVGQNSVRLRHVFTRIFPADHYGLYKDPPKERGPKHDLPLQHQNEHSIPSIVHFQRAPTAYYVLNRMLLGPD